MDTSNNQVANVCINFNSKKMRLSQKSQFTADLLRENLCANFVILFVFIDIKKKPGSQIASGEYVIRNQGFQVIKAFHDLLLAH
jgi:hypothetical protein